MRCIADANVLLPLLTEGHAHQAPAADWWNSCDDSRVGLSLPVRMALLRPLSNTRVMGSSVLRPAAAWNVVQRLIDDPRVEVVEAHDCEMVAFDRGFRSFSKLKLRLLESVG